MELRPRELAILVRSLLRRPLFSLQVIAIVAVGIAGAASIFSVVDALILEASAFEDPGRLVHFQSSIPSKNVPTFAISPAEYADIREENTSFDDVALYMGQALTLNLTTGEEPVRIAGRRVTASFFPVLGVRPALGRGFTPEEEAGDSGPVAILSDRLFRSRFGADRSLVSSTIPLNGVATTVLGVLPSEFSFASTEVDVWLPLGFEAATQDRTFRQFRGIGRLAPGATFEEARTDLARIADRLAEDHPATHGGFEAEVRTLQQWLLGENFSRTWTMALLAALCLFAVASANVGSLFLARTLERERELAIRSVLGAGRARLLRAHVTEAAVLALPGTLLGLLLAAWGIEVLRAFLPADLPRAADVGLDASIVGATVLLAGATVLLSGLLPGLMAASAPTLGRGLREGRRGSSRRTGQAMRVLVLFEVGLALALLVTTALVALSFQRLRDVDRGFGAADVVAARFSVPEARTSTPRELSALLETVEDRVRSLPGVVSAALANEVPVTGYINWGTRFSVQGGADPLPGQEPLAQLRVVGRDYFRALRIPLLEGGDLPTDARPDDPWLVVVDEILVRRHFPDGGAVGRSLVLTTREGRFDARIVGVVGGVRPEGPRTELRETIYLSFLQRPLHETSLVVRTAADVPDPFPRLREAVREVDPDLPLFRMHSLTDAVRRDLAAERALAMLFGTSMVMALLLATTGLYGVLASSVARRRREIGIRLALGADRATVVLLVVRQAMALLALGLVPGAILTTLASHRLAPLLYETRADEPGLVVGVAVTLVFVGLLAAAIPAGRATAVSPTDALRAS